MKYLIAIFMFVLVLLWASPAKAGHPPVWIRGLMCDTERQIRLFLDYLNENPTLNIETVAEIINKHVKVEGACIKVEKRFPGYFVAKFEPYELGNRKITILLYYVLFLEEQGFIYQYMYNLKELGQPI